MNISLSRSYLIQKYGGRKEWQYLPREHWGAQRGSSAHA